MILLKDILIESKMYSYDTSQALEKLLNFQNKTIVLFDTETTGLDPNDFYVQITEISAMAVNGSTLEPLNDDFNATINVRPEIDRLTNDPKSKEALDFDKENARHLQKYKKPITTPSELMKMTNYDGGTSEKMDEKEALIKFSEYLSKFKGVVLIAHNATFDMKAIQSRARINGLPRFEDTEVLDTVKLSRYFFVPILLSLENDEESKKYLAGLLAKTKAKSYSLSLPKLASVFEIKIDGWHEAKQDVKMLFGVLKSLIEYLKKHKDVDIKSQQSKAAKRYRNIT